MEKAFFKAIDGKPEYAATIDGELYHYFRTAGFKRLNPFSVNGSQYVKIDGKTTSVGGTILTEFVGDKPDESARPFHINGITTDNTIENLVWATPSEIRRLAEVTPGNRREALDAIRSNDYEKFIELSEDYE